MASKQFEHLQESTLRRLQGRIPSRCLLFVSRPPAGGFRAATLDERDSCTGRAQVVAAWIDGYVAAWSRTARPRASESEPHTVSAGGTAEDAAYWAQRTALKRRQ
jgi:hypothetical protein